MFCNSQSFTFLFHPVYFEAFQIKWTTLNRYFTVILGENLCTILHSSGLRAEQFPRFSNWLVNVDCSMISPYQRFSYIMISGGKKNTNNLSVHASKILKRIILLAIESKILKLALDQNFNFESSPFTLLFFQNLIIYCILHSQMATSPPKDFLHYWRLVASHGMPTMADIYNYKGLADNVGNAHEQVIPTVMICYLT